MWRSVLSGNGSTINIGYAATFARQGATEITENIMPVIFCRSTKILIVRDGHVTFVY
jgi:hypothetical protein